MLVLAASLNHLALADTEDASTVCSWLEGLDIRNRCTQPTTRIVQMSHGSYGLCERHVAVFTEWILVNQ